MLNTSIRLSGSGENYYIEAAKPKNPSDETEFRWPFLSCGVLGVCRRIGAASTFSNIKLQSCLSIIVYAMHDQSMSVQFVCTTVSTHTHTHRFMGTQTHWTRCDHSARVPSVCGCTRALNYFLSYIIFIYTHFVKSLEAWNQWVLKIQKCSVRYSYEFVWLLLS